VLGCLGIPESVVPGFKEPGKLRSGGKRPSGCVDIVKEFVPILELGK